MEVLSLRREKSEIPQRIDRLTGELSRAQSSLSHEQERMHLLEKEKKAKEATLKEEEERLSHSEKKLSEVKTNKEYQAALKEIEEHKQQNSRLEEEILVTMEGLDSLKEAVARMEEGLAVKERETQADIDELTKRARLTEDHVSKKEEIRKELAGKIDPSYLSAYERLMRVFANGSALVRIEKGVCKGCFMNLPPQFFNEMLRDKDIKTCPNCARLIYLDDGPDEAAAKGMNG
jgi:predicted  nucleic acid-binding Zn-ribbon protein